MESKRKRRTIRKVPSPAMVVACLALAVALSGVGYAAVVLPANSVGALQIKTNAVRTAELMNGQVKGADVHEASLGQVPSAANAANAVNATNAGNADKLDNVDSAEFVKRGSSEAWHELGAPGQPAFAGAWVNEWAAGETTGAFYKDPLDVVHLKGIITGGNGLIFVLPEGYRPSKIGCLTTWRAGAIAYVCVYPNGNVSKLGGGATGALLLDGLTFRAGM
jgi:hypothetical protein